jgi:hypothetical protein
MIENQKEKILQTAELITEETKKSLEGIKTIAIGEAWKILQLTVAGIVQIIENIANDWEGQEKKAVAIEYINNFYDKVFSVIDVPFLPSFIEPMFHKYIKKILMIMTSSSIDATVTIFRTTGVFLKKGI